MERSHFTLYNILIGLTVGLSFVPYLGTVGTSLMASRIGAHLTIALQELPMVSRAIWPQRTFDSQLIQIGLIDTEIGNINREIGNMLNAGLRLIMTDISTFVSFVHKADGHFSGDNTLSVYKITTGLDMALKTFIVSTAMSKNDWRASPILYYTREDLAEARDCTFDLDDICSNPSNPSVSYFYSNVSGNAYSLFGANSSQLLHRIVSDNWSTLVARFDGAFNCTSSGNGADQPFQIKMDGTVDLSCVSQLYMCGGCTACMVPLINGTCPMPKCPACE